MKWANLLPRLSWAGPSRNQRSRKSASRNAVFFIPAVKRALRLLSHKCALHRSSRISQDGENYWIRQQALRIARSIAFFREAAGACRPSPTSRARKTKARLKGSARVSETREKGRRRPSSSLLSSSQTQGERAVVVSPRTHSATRAESVRPFAPQGERRQGIEDTRHTPRSRREDRYEDTPSDLVASCALL